MLNQWANGVDAICCTIEGGQPSFNDSGVDVTSFDISGNYELSGSLPSNPTALIYYVSIPLIDYDNLNQNYIIDYVLLKVETSGLILTIVTDTIVFANESNYEEKIISNAEISPTSKIIVQFITDGEEVSIQSMVCGVKSQSEGGCTIFAGTEQGATGAYNINILIFN